MKDDNSDVVEDLLFDIFEEVKTTPKEMGRLRAVDRIIASALKADGVADEQIERLTGCRPRDHTATAILAAMSFR
jgi:hypothetical protein